MRFILIWFIVGLFSACDNDHQNIALGTLERDRIAHSATTNEVVVALPVTKCSMVKKGTILVRLDDTQQNAQVAKAVANVAQAKANLEMLQKGAREEEIASARASVAGAKATLVESEANYKRTQDLVKNNLSSLTDLDRTLASRDSYTKYSSRFGGSQSNRT